jgi:hypothetical protein
MKITFSEENSVLSAEIRTIPMFSVEPIGIYLSLKSGTEIQFEESNWFDMIIGKLKIPFTKR